MYMFVKIALVIGHVQSYLVVNPVLIKESFAERNWPTCGKIHVNF